jgi:hypothetical protein
MVPDTTKISIKLFGGSSFQNTHKEVLRARYYTDS